MLRSTTHHDTKVTCSETNGISMSTTWLPKSSARASTPRGVASTTRAPPRGPVAGGGVDVAYPVAHVLDEIVLGAEGQSHPVTPARAAKSPATGGCALAHGGAASSSAAARMASSGALP